MLKVLLLQSMHTLSDERCEYLVKDRLSFMRSLGLGLADTVPDANTIWTFREALKRANAIEALFARFDAQKAEIKAGRIPPDWARRPAKLRQKASGRALDSEV
jgi:transposase, IS5 family